MAICTCTWASSRCSFFFCAFLCTLPLLFLSFFSWAIGVIVVLFCFVFLFCLTRHDFFGYDFYFLINLGDFFFWWVVYHFFVLIGHHFLIRVYK